ncbi:sec1 family domain-containing protein 1-like [Dysidea avara]|uniref:sec1 family domain-containing protein 1-like n=1 Tax=Dysidea avara TaxID=196820 RepID=UPI003330CF19
MCTIYHSCHLQVFDQYVHFISLEEDLFIVRNQDREAISYYALNNPDSKDTDINLITDSIVECLFSVLVTASVVPIIRCPRGNAAEAVAEALDKKLRENLRDTRNSMFTGDNIAVAQLSFQRPLLVILDRNFDLTMPLHHTWTYQALVHDLLDFDLNRVSLQPEVSELDSSTRGPAKSYDLPCSDKFWQFHRGSPIPSVADAVQSELEQYKQSEEEVKRLKDAMVLSHTEFCDLHNIVYTIIGLK